MEEHRSLKHLMGDIYSPTDSPFRDYIYEIVVKLEDSAPSPNIIDAHKFYFRSSSIKMTMEDLEKLESRCGKISR